MGHPGVDYFLNNSGIARGGEAKEESRIIGTGIGRLSAPAAFGIEKDLMITIDIFPERYAAIINAADLGWLFAVQFHSAGGHVEDSPEYFPGMLVIDRENFRRLSPDFLLFFRNRDFHINAITFIHLFGSKGGIL